MDRFDALTLFTRIVETGSFTRAANGLDMPRATATLAIQQLEARLGARLLARTTRQVHPTPEGAAFYERCVHLLAELEEAEAALGPVAASPAGTLRVEMHGVHARHIVLPHIQEFRARYPRLDVVLTSGDRRVDLVGEGIDCALRAGEPADSSLIGRRLAELPQTICASPAYLDRAGRPRHRMNCVIIRWCVSSPAATPRTTPSICASTGKYKDSRAAAGSRSTTPGAT